jgi:hypothetical protein
MLHAFPPELFSIVLEYVCPCIAQLHGARLTLSVLPNGRSEKPLLGFKSLALSDYIPTIIRISRSQDNLSDLDAGALSRCQTVAAVWLQIVDWHRTQDFLCNMIPIWYQQKVERALKIMERDHLRDVTLEGNPDSGDCRLQSLSAPLSLRHPDRKTFIAVPPDQLFDRYSNGITNHRSFMPTPPYIHLPPISCQDTPSDAGCNNYQTLPSIRSALGASFFPRAPTPPVHYPLAGTENIAAYSVPLVSTSTSQRTRSRRHWTPSDDALLSELLLKYPHLTHEQLTAEFNSRVPANRKRSLYTIKKKTKRSPAHL